MIDVDRFGCDRLKSKGAAKLAVSDLLVVDAGAGHSRLRLIILKKLGLRFVYGEILHIYICIGPDSVFCFLKS